MSTSTKMYAKCLLKNLIDYLFVNMLSKYHTRRVNDDVPLFSTYGLRVKQLQPYVHDFNIKNNKGTQVIKVTQRKLRLITTSGFSNENALQVVGFDIPKIIYSLINWLPKIKHTLRKSNNAPMYGQC
ncbi:hypothetical protein GQX74_005536 [Glossina fuscipes]|nr:hypothetical protein GQX74_005536 [Glossina fuscipes]